MVDGGAKEGTESSSMPASRFISVDAYSQQKAMCVNTTKEGVFYDQF